MNLILKVWRQDGADDDGRFETHQINGVSEDSSFLEMMDQLNEQLLEEGNEFSDGETITVEPFRARAFPVVRDLVVDRSAFDRITQAGGFITVRTGSAPDGNALPVPKDDSDKAMDAAACIGCGACVASCKNASAMLFTAAKAGHLNLLPQGQAEKDKRVLSMVSAMDKSGFGNCRNYGECSAACPKDISLDYIAKLNRDHAKAKIKKIFA